MAASASVNDLISTCVCCLHARLEMRELTRPKRAEQDLQDEEEERKKYKKKKKKVNLRGRLTMSLSRRVSASRWMMKLSFEIVRERATLLYH